MKRFVFSIFLILVSGNSSSAQSQQGTPKCKPNGEYCQNHWDCCSGSCFSYLYKCVGSSEQNHQVNVVSLQASNSPGISSSANNISLEELIYGLFASTPRPAVNFVDQYILASRLGENDSIGTSSPRGGTEKISSQRAPNEQLSNEERFQETATPEASKVTSSTGSSTDDIFTCKLIGQKCFQHSECCTYACHGFLHQCVT